MTTPNIGSRVEWIGVRTAAPRRGVVTNLRGVYAEIRTDKGGYTDVAIADLTVLS